MVWETIIILLDFGSKQLDKEGSPDSGLPNSLYRLNNTTDLNCCSVTTV
jgi:hypothetical protein